MDYIIQSNKYTAEKEKKHKTVLVHSRWEKNAQKK